MATNCILYVPDGEGSHLLPESKYRSAVTALKADGWVVEEDGLEARGRLENKSFEEGQTSFSKATGFTAFPVEYDFQCGCCGGFIIADVWEE